MKDKLLGALGGFGIVLWYILLIVVAGLPFAMIGTRFWITALLIGVECCLPISSVVFWIWGLICAIQEEQDVWAILYYIAFAVMFCPFFINTLSALFGRKR